MDEIKISEKIVYIDSMIDELMAHVEELNNNVLYLSKNLNVDPDLVFSVNTPKIEMMDILCSCLIENFPSFQLFLNREKSEFSSLNNNTQNKKIINHLMLWYNNGDDEVKMFLKIKFGNSLDF